MARPTNLLLLAAVAATAISAPTLGSAQTRYDDGRTVERREGRVHSYDRNSNRNCSRDRRSSANKGTVAGALVGGGSGALIGGDLAGGIVGAGVGAVAGHEIAKRRVRC